MDCLKRIIFIVVDDIDKNRTEVYNDDNGGNILSTKVYPLTWGSLSGVTATKTTNYTYVDSNWKDKLTAYGDTPITYDAIGKSADLQGLHAHMAERQTACVNAAHADAN